MQCYVCKQQFRCGCTDKQKGDEMKYNDFCKEIARREKGKKEVDIAQIKEILRIISELLLPAGVDVMKLVRKL